MMAKKPANDSRDNEPVDASGTRKKRRATLHLEVGARLFTEHGYVVVVELTSTGVVVETSTGLRHNIGYAELTGVQVHNGHAVPVQLALEPWWSSLPQAVSDEALLRLEVVLEVLTGYRWGHARLAQPGEPRLRFGNTHYSESIRADDMARTLSYEQTADRKVLRRHLDGEIGKTTISKRTVQRWIHDWREEGMRGLVDKHSVPHRQGFDALDARVRRITDEVLAEFDGDRSRLNTTTIETKVLQRMKQEGIEVAPPQRLFQEYLSDGQRALGRTTRSHRTRHISRKTSSHTSFTAADLGVVALDATRADVMVWDPLQQRTFSVEILTVIHVATRVVLALRVTPRSGNAAEAGLVLYDALRPMSMLVENDTAPTDWRWAGVFETLDLSNVAVHRSAHRIIPAGRTLLGEHLKPAVKASGVRCDHGSVFLSKHFIALLDHLGIDLLLSRGSKPTDNAYIERFHETLQRAYQAIPGFKGRNVSERGRKVTSPGKGLLTAEELERHLRRFVALDYHRSWHEGLALPGLPEARLTPLEMWDSLMEVAGRLDVPQHPDLIHQFLPVRWLTIGHGGVEYKNLAYDDPILRDFGNVRLGTFKEGSRKVPFSYDPRDVTRLWFRNPDTDRIHEIDWKGRHIENLPLGSFMRDRALEHIAARGGNWALKRKITTQEIIDTLGELTPASEITQLRGKAYAAQLRFDQAQRDHQEAVDAAQALASEPASTPSRRKSSGASVVRPLRPQRVPRGPDGPTLRTSGGTEIDLDEAWPDYGDH